MLVIFVACVGAIFVDFKLKGEVAKLVLKTLKVEKCDKNVFAL